MREDVNEMIATMARQLEIRAKIPAADIWPCERADLTKAFDYSSNPLISLLYNLYKADISSEQLAKLFYRPSRIAYLNYLFTASATDAENIEKRVLVAEKNIELISILRNGDPLLKKNNGNNIIIDTNDEEYKFKFEKLLSTDIISSESERISRCVFAALSALIEHAYYSWIGAAKEYHGLYDYKGNKIFIRDYYNLKLEHWNFTRNIKWNKIQFISVEDENASVKIDFNGRVNKFNGNIKKMILIIDDKIVPEEDYLSTITELFDILKKSLNEAVEEVDGGEGMSASELLIKFVRSQFYSVQDVCRKSGLNINCDIPEEMIERMKKSDKDISGVNEIRKRCMGDLTIEERMKIFTRLLDPRY